MSITNENIVEVANRVAPLVEDEIKEVVFNLPTVSQQVDVPVIEIYRSVTDRMIRWAYAMSRWDAGHHEEAEDFENLKSTFVVPKDVIDLECEKQIKLAIIDLCAKIYWRYKPVADHLNLKLDGTNFYQRVEVPFAYEELPIAIIDDGVPLRFRVYTKRQLLTEHEALVKWALANGFVEENR